MKKMMGLIAIIFLVGVNAVVAQDDFERTEEYAIVDVFEYGKRK